MGRTPMLKAKRERELVSHDPVWSNIRREAAEVVRREPELSSFVLANVLNHDTLEEALCHRLAQRLGHDDVNSDLIRQTFAHLVHGIPDYGLTLRADIAAVYDRDPACTRFIDPLLYFKGFHALQTHRFAHALWHEGRTDFALYLQSRASCVFSIDIHPNARIGKAIMIDHGTAVVIGETASIGDHTSILHGVTLGGSGKEGGDRHPKVGSGVLIGAGAKILGNIRVGNCARIAAGSVVLKDVPDNKTVAGVPAKIVGEAGCNQPSHMMDQIIRGEDLGQPE